MDRRRSGEPHDVLGLGETRLSIYLNDHLAGSTLGANVAQRAAEDNRDNDYGAELSTLADEIQQDRRALLDLMDRLSVARDPVKAAAAWAAEKAARVKLSGEFVGYSPLSRLEQLETV